MFGVRTAKNKNKKLRNPYALQLLLQAAAVIMRLRSEKSERRNGKTEKIENNEKIAESGENEFADDGGETFSAKRSSDGRAITSEAMFRRKLKSYIKHCCENEKQKRLPNAAGFCRFCSISRKEFASLGECYPLMFDIAQSTFIDEALNNKFPNSAANMNYLAGLTNSICGLGGETLKIVCEHDPASDGE